MTLKGLQEYGMRPKDYPSEDTFIRAVEQHEQQEDMTKVTNPIKQKIKKGLKKIAENVTSPFKKKEEEEQKVVYVDEVGDVPPEPWNLNIEEK